MSADGKHIYSHFFNVYGILSESLYRVHMIQRIGVYAFYYPAYLRRILYGSRLIIYEYCTYKDSVLSDGRFKLFHVYISLFVNVKDSYIPAEFFHAAHRHKHCRVFYRSCYHMFSASGISCGSSENSPVVAFRSSRSIVYFIGFGIYGSRRYFTRGYNLFFRPYSHHAL